MSDAERPGTTGGGPFEGIDPKLNVFALANGMDLSKRPERRRLEWFTEGLERGIVIEAEEGGRFRIHVESWRTGSEEVESRASVGGGLSVADLTSILQSAIEQANGL